jgi:hypothetical protein
MVSFSNRKLEAALLWYLLENLFLFGLPRLIKLVYAKCIDYVSYDKLWLMLISLKSSCLIVLIEGLTLC